MSKITAGISSAQMEIWLAQQLMPDSPNNIAEYLHLSGPLDPDLFFKTLRQVASETPALQVNFSIEDGRPCPVSRVHEDWSPDFIDVSTHGEPEHAALRAMRERVEKPFDLARDALFRWTLIRLADERHIFCHVYHHIAMDVAGYVMLLQRIAEVYGALREGQPAPACGFADADAIVREEERYRQSEQFAVDRAFWQARSAELATAEPPLPAADGPFLAFAQTAVIPEDACGGLRMTAERLGVSQSRLLTAAIVAYFHRWGGQQEILFRLAVSARSDATRHAPGHLAHALPLLASLPPRASLADIARQLDGEVERMRPHTRYRAEDIVRDQAGAGLGRGAQGPVINLMPFAYRFEFGACRVESAHQLTVGVLDTLEVAVHDRKNGDGLHLDLYASERGCPPEPLRRHALRLARFIVEAAAEPSQPVSDIELLDEAERRQLLVDWNRTGPDHGQATFPQLFETQAALTPHAVALESPDARLSYAELDARANRLARHLQSLGVGADVLVGICLERSIDMVVAVLGVLKSGAAYLPLSPEYPTERLAYMLGDSMAPVLLTDSAQVERLPSYWGRVVELDRLDLDALPDSAPERALRAEHLAYVIYTSGSTGQPKGVAVSHAGLAGLAGSQTERFALQGPTRVLQFASLSFDAAVMEMLMAFCSGGRLVLPAAGPLLGEQLLDTLNRHEISHALISPSALSTADAALAPVLRTLVVGGEACPGATVAAWSAGRRMVNAYGPTEATACVTMSEPLSGDGAPKLGRPTHNARLYVLDGALQLAPVGVAGELYIAGAGLARGYLNRPGLTAERFVANPYGEGERLYRSGDLARWTEEGELEYLGRSDQQVKVRGFRIEPGEIEAVLNRHPQVSQSVVVARQSQGGDSQLVAYVAAVGGVEGSELRRLAAGQLPEHMVPAAVVVLESLPQLPNGKLDRKSLPAPEFGGSHYQRPRNAQEEMLCGLFAEVLEVGSVGIDDSFFDLGGHSLLATRLISRIRAALNVELPIRQLFDLPSVAELLEVLPQYQGAARPALQPRRRQQHAVRS
nr:NRPS [Chromobacterium vaccinii]